jgi:16S rRNA (cytosine967-C5)-methyltransferase
MTEPSEADRVRPPLATALRLAAEVIAAVIGGRNLNEALARCWARNPGLAGAARAAAMDLSYTALRAYGRDDFYLSRLMRRPPPAEARGLLLAALARLKERPAEAHTTVDQAVEAAGGVARGRYRAMVNAVLRNFLRRGAELEVAAGKDEVACFRHPAWWLARLRRDWPDDWRGIVEAGNGHPPMALRVNRLRVSTKSYLDMLSAAGIEARLVGESGLLLARPVPVERLPGFFEGLASVQDFGAQMAAPLLDVRPGMRVLDACAAPGGKTAHLLELAGAAGTVEYGPAQGARPIPPYGAGGGGAVEYGPGGPIPPYDEGGAGRAGCVGWNRPKRPYSTVPGAIDLLALDSDASRLARVQENLDRLGLAAELKAADCRRLDDWWDGRPFERVLADVPCSASGVVRRHPDIKWLRRDADIAGFAATQAQILESLWRVLTPGGRLLYVTCSVFAEENGARIADFAARHVDCLRLPLDGAPQRQLLPQAEHDGFFYALLEKRT